MPREQIKSQRPDNDAKQAGRSPPFTGKSTSTLDHAGATYLHLSRSRRALNRNGAARRQGTRYCSSDRRVPVSALRYALLMFRSFRTARPPSEERTATRSEPRIAARCPRRACGSVRGRAFLLSALLMPALGCGQDVLVARWTLLSDAPDASPIDDPDGADTGSNQQSIHAQRARDRARVRESMANDGHGSSDEKNH
jgi:hypothetical protein